VQASAAYQGRSQMPSGERQGVVGVGSGGEAAVAALLEPDTGISTRLSSN
jgi:hypothetical protein